MGWSALALVLGTTATAGPESSLGPLEQMAQVLAGTCPFDLAIGPFQTDAEADPCPPSFSGADVTASAERIVALGALEPSSHPAADPVAEASRLRARAVWRLLSSRSEGAIGDAVAELAQAAELEPQDAWVASDLVGALVLLARATDDPRHLLRALDLVELAPDGHLPATKNRRVLLEELGFLADAEGDGAARRWEEVRREWESGRLSTAGLALHAQSHPQQLRELAEQELLGWWAQALDNSVEAERRLAGLAEIAAAIAQHRGETALRDTVAQLQVEPVRQRRLGDGYLAYQRGLAAVRALDYEVAAQELRVAAAILEVELSPMAPWARHYCAVADFFRGAVPRALAEQLAVAAYSQALAGRRSLHARALWSIGHINMTSSRRPQAIEPSTVARDLFADLGEDENQAAVEALLAEVYFSLGEEVLALRALREASRRRRAITNVLRRHNVDMLWLEHARRLGLGQAALFFLGELRRSAEILGDPLARFQVALVALSLASSPQLVDALEVQARDHISGLDTENLQRLAEATLDLEVARRLLVSDPRRAGEAAARATAAFQRSSYESEVEAGLIQAIAAARSGQPERSHALLLSATRRVAAIRAGVADPAGRARYLSTVERIAAAWKDLMDRVGANDEQVWAGVAALRRAARGYGIATSTVPSFAEVVGGLGSRDLVLEYILGEETVEVWYFGAEGVERQRLEISVAQVRRLIHGWHNGGDPTTVEALGEALLAGASRRVQDGMRVTVVPTDVLFGVPWSQLKLPGTARPLVARVELAIALSSLPGEVSSAESIRGARALFMADPEPARAASLERLPGSLAEVRGAAQWYAESEILTGREGTLGALRRHLADRPAVVHLGVHAVSDELSRGGRLLLASDGLGDDGEVEAADLARLPLDGVRTVVLAACRVRGARGPDVGAPFDLVRALLEAGAAEVVASDRDLDDQLTAELMVRLHQHLAAGQSGAAALRLVWLGTEDPRLRAAVESLHAVRHTAERLERRSR